MKALRFRGISLATFVVVFLFHSLAFGQGSDPHITGIVTDSSKAIIRGAQVDLINVDTGVHYPTITNSSGIYGITGKVGNYRIEVGHAGFKTVIDPNIVLHTADALEINFEMAVGSASELVTVNAGATNDSPAVSMTVSREFIEKMPLNGQSLQDLIQLAPGTVAAAGPNRGNTGYYTIDGQRTDSNNYSVDGVSANLGGFLNSSNTISVGPGLSGASPSQTVLGTTQSLVSIDALQEFTIQTSGYAAEYGRSPGGQVQFTTRSGTSDIHGTIFDYLRNTAFDAKSFQEDYYDEPKSAEHQNDFGGTVGGPLIIPKLYNGKDKTFYFVTYEGLRLLLPQFETEYVPTHAFRQWSSPNVQPYLNAIPLPNGSNDQDGCTIPDPTTGQPTACDALFNYGYSTPSNLNNISLRIDQNLGKRFHGFVRYADTPSSSAGGAETVETNAINTHTWTVGLTTTITNTLLDDLRFNYSRDGEHTISSLKAVGGSVPFSRNLIIPAAYDSAYAYGSVVLELPGTPVESDPTYGGQATAQHQYQVVDSLAWTRGHHNIKFGADWRRLTPTWIDAPYTSYIYIESLAGFQNGYADNLETDAIATGKPVFDNLSLYAQDHWQFSPRLGLDYGLRWEFNPPPGPSNGRYPAVLTSSDLPTAALAPVGTQPYKTNYHSFAPRFGFAWNAIPAARDELTVRGGFGIFFDTGQSTIGAAYASAYPFAAYGPLLETVPLPASAAALAPPSLDLPLAPPYPHLVGLSSPDLTLPYTEQWNVSIDETLNKKSTLTISYVGNNGRKLLFTQYYGSVPGNSDFPKGLTFTNNISQSSYNALQVQGKGRIANGFDFVGSFTWGHALDNASNDFSTYSPVYGNSDYDLRRLLNLALNYQTSEAGPSRWIRSAIHGWLLASRFSTQSGYPLNIRQAYVVLPNGADAEYSPDLVPGVPIYLHGSAAELNGTPIPGNWRLNSAAFVCVPTNTGKSCSGTPIRQGTLGRNYLRTPSFWALNTALQRSFPIYEKLQINFRVDAFNILNHPNLNFIQASFPSSTFGYSMSGAGTIGSSNSLYAMGAARSLQLSLKLVF